MYPIFRYLGVGVIVIVGQVLGRYVIIRYLDPFGFLLTLNPNNLPYAFLNEPHNEGGELSSGQAM